jgi:hypothetical protein
LEQEATRKLLEDVPDDGSNFFDRARTNQAHCRHHVNDLFQRRDSDSSESGIVPHANSPAEGPPLCSFLLSANRFSDAVIISCVCFFADPGVVLLWLSWMLTLPMSTATQMFDHAKNRRSFLLIY